MKANHLDESFSFLGRSMSALPVALSVMASFFSASNILGAPAEIYLRGTMYWIGVFTAMLTPLVGAFIFGPLFHSLKILSVYEVRLFNQVSLLLKNLKFILFDIKI